MVNLSCAIFGGSFSKMKKLKREVSFLFSSGYEVLVCAVLGLFLGKIFLTKIQLTMPFQSTKPVLTENFLPDRKSVV